MTFSLRSLITILFACMFAATLLFIPSVTSAEDELPEHSGEKTSLNIYNWGQYLSDGTDGYLDVIEEFEEAYPNIHVNYMTYDNNEAMYTKLKTAGTSFDLLIPSDYMIEKLINEDMLAPIDFSNIPNYKYIDETFKNLAYDPDNIYSVPYTWGYVGLIYNSRYVDEADVGSWDLLWNEKYSGKILMFDNPRDAFAIAELALGYSINTEDEAELKKAAEKLSDEKALVQAYVMDQVFDKMERSEAWITPYYAGDYLLMVEENPDLKFNIPEEGFNLFVDACCIPKTAEHKTEAELFINFLCQPYLSGENLEYLSYSTPITKAREFMDPEFAESEIIHPDKELLQKGESFVSLSSDGTKLMNDLWLEIKTSNSLLLSYLIPVVIVFGLIIFIWAFSTIRKQRLRSRRCTRN